MSNINTDATTLSFKTVSSYECITGNSNGIISFRVKPSLCNKSSKSLMVMKVCTKQKPVLRHKLIFNDIQNSF